MSLRPNPNFVLNSSLPRVLPQLLSLVLVLDEKAVVAEVGVEDVTVVLFVLLSVA